MRLLLLMFVMCGSLVLVFDEQAEMSASKALSSFLEAVASDLSGRSNESRSSEIDDGETNTSDRSIDAKPFAGGQAIANSIDELMESDRRGEVNTLDLSASAVLTGSAKQGLIRTPESTRDEVSVSSIHDANRRAMLVLERSASIFQ